MSPRRLFSGGVVIALLTLAACSSGSSGTPVPTATVTTTVTQTVTATPRATASTTSSSAAASTACATSALAVQIGVAQAGAGQRFAPIILKNISTSSCTMLGYPGMQLVRSNGAKVPTDVVRVGSPKAKVHTLAPGASASSDMSFGVVATGSEPSGGACEPTAASVLVTPPNQTTALKTAWKLGPVCNKGRIAVNAFVPGSDG